MTERETILPIVVGKVLYMRVLQITGYMMGAQKTITEAIHHYVSAEGSDSLILYARGNSEECGAIRCETKLANLLTRGLRKYVCKQPGWSFLQTNRMIRYIRRFKPDLVHLHVLHGGCMDYTRLFRYLAKEKIPVVYTMHDMWAFTGGCYHYSSRACRGYQTDCSVCPANKQELDVSPRLVKRSLKKKQDLYASLPSLHMVTVSQWVKQEMESSVLAHYPTHVIRNGIDTDVVPYEAAPEHHDDIRILSVAASWTEQKGIYLLLELAELLGSAYTLYLVGAGSEAIKKAAPENVVFVGYCSDRSELYTYYRHADLYVSASQEETFGMTFVEAAMMGTRSIGCGKTAIRETLSSVQGLIVEEFTASAYADAIRKVMKEENNKIPAEQVQRIRERFSAETMAKEYYDLYRRVLEQR